MGSKFYMNKRLLSLKKTIKPYVHKRRFKSKFTKSATDRALRHAIANSLKRPSYWRTLKHMTKTLSPIMRSLRMCDSRMEGKAGLVYPSLCRMKTSTLKYLEKASNQDWELTTQLQCQNVELWYVPWFSFFYRFRYVFNTFSECPPGVHKTHASDAS